MTEVYPGNAIGAASSDHEDAGAALGIAKWLGLAATPSFVLMALLTGALGGGDMLCSAMLDASPLSGMTPMYVLMSVFHSAPWLRLIFQGAPTIA